MDDIANLTVSNYIRCVDDWYAESKELPINQWNVFQPARRWMWKCQGISDGKSGADIQD